MRSTLEGHFLSTRENLRKLIFGKLARASAGLFAGVLASGGLAYLYQVLMGRMLPPEQYGVLSALMALSSVVSAPLGTIMMAVSKQVSAYRAKLDAGSILHFFNSINRKGMLTGLFFFAIFAFFVSDIKTYLKVSESLPVYLLGVLVLFTFPQIINQAFLQGLQLFGWLSMSSVWGISFKMIFSILLVWLGFGVSGALGGAIIAAFAVWGATYVSLHAPLMAGRGQKFQVVHLPLKPVAPIFVANLAFAAMTQLDVVLVNYFFSPHDAGMYAAASVLGKAVMYLPGGITMALFPMVADNDAKGEGSSHLLLQAVGLTLLLCGAGAVFYFFFGELITSLLYGQSYKDAGEILKLYGFAILPMALVMIAEHFLIAKGRVLFAYLFMVFAPLQIGAIYLYHDSLKVVVTVMGLSGVLVALVGYLLLWRESRGGEIRR